MIPRIGDIIRDRTAAESHSDVQLAHYFTSQNADLLRHYIFTSRAPTGKKCTIALLQTFCDAFSAGVQENRFGVIATYGHGKSHFALALANFFGKPFGSPESTTVLGAIRRAIPDQDSGTYGYFESFKHQRQPFLVLILRGDEPNDLPTKLHRALKEALVHDAGEQAASDLPFWFKGAEEFLVKASNEHLRATNQYLAQFDLDLDALLAKVRDRQASVHDICAGLAQHLHGFAPKFDQGLGLAEVVKWVVENKCGPGKAYAGLLILFDEFSAFVANYCDRNVPGRPLQDLLNGVSDTRGKAAFVAFAQHDPNDVARSNAGGLKLANILVELGRLPDTKRFQLHSSLEEVLESYLQKRQDAWLDLLRNNKPFSGGLDEATNNTLKAFKMRYLDELRWDTERFHSLVTLGCYPLHPLTTSIICSVELQATNNTRSVLGVVQEAVKHIDVKPVQTEVAPTWIRATYLVDYFEEMLGEDNWRLYKGAISKLSQADEPDQITVLKAMLLQTVVKVSTEKMGYPKTIAELSGLSVPGVSEVLAQLTERGIIRRDVVTGNYTIAPAGWGDKGERIAQFKMQQAKVDAQTIEDLRNDLESLGLGNRPMSVAWGHQDDWHAKQILADRATLTRQYLQGICRHISWKLDVTPSQKARALIIWLIAATDEDVEWYRGNTSKLIKDAFGEEATPLVVMRPNTPSTALIDRLKRKIALKRFTPQERAEAEQAWYRDSVDQADRQLKAAFESYFRDDCTWEVPGPFRARLAATNTQTLNSVLSEVIQMAYPDGHRRWFDQYRLGQNQLVNAVSIVCAKLIQSGRIEAGALDGNSLAKDIVLRHLVDPWEVLNASGRPIEPSPGGAVDRAWTALDDFFKMGEPGRNARPILEKLLNPPFGYDWNTLALLASSWWALHRYDLDVQGGLPLAGNLALVKPRDILEKIGACSIRRREDPTAEIRELVQAIRSGSPRSKSVAQAELRDLNAFLQREGLDPMLKEMVTDAVKTIDEGLRNASLYDEEAKQIRLQSERNTLPELISSLSKVRRLPATSLVKPEMPTPDKLSGDIKQAIENYIEKLCATYGSLKRLEDYAAGVGQLQAALKYIENSGLASSMQKVKDAIVALQKAKRDLEGKAELEANRREQETLIRSLPSRGRLSDLRQALAELNGITPQAEIKDTWENKRNAISKELSRIEGFAQSFSSELDRAIDGKAVLKLRDKVLREQTLCDEAQVRAQIEAGISRCELLATFFSTIESLQKTSRSCPEDFARDRGHIQSLIDRTSPSMSEEQQAEAENALAALDTSLATERRRAQQRLEGLKEDLRRSVPPDKVQSDLERAVVDWRFLPDDATGGLDELQQQIQALVEQARAKRDEEARKKAEREHQESTIKNLPVRGLMSELRRSLNTLDQMNPQPELKPLWEKKRDAAARELERLGGLATTLNNALDRVVDHRSVETSHTEALRDSSLCDEEETRQSLTVVLERCKAIREYFEQIDKVRKAVRTNAGDFERDNTTIERVLQEKSDFLSEAQRSVAQNAILDLNRALADKQRQARERLGRLEQGQSGTESASKIQRDLEKGDWTFLPADAIESLRTLRARVQERIDGDESQKVELHFRNIRDKQQRRTCLEALQRLVLEGE